MNFITQKALHRRTVLRGVGATLALPLLDAMVPALANAQATKSPTRLSIVYLPNGIMMDKWTPATTGANYQLTPILEPLAAFKNQMLVLTGLAHSTGRALAGENTGDHARAGASYLSGVHPKKTEGADTEAGVSMDQIAAAQLSKETQLASLELGIESNAMLGSCDGGSSCAYTNTIAWRTPTTPLPIENDPRAVFERLFGTSGSTDKSARLARIARDKSVLDFVGEEINRLGRAVGPRDKIKVDEYIEAVRDTERRIQMAEQQSARELPVVDQPPGVPSDYAEHAKLMMDLLLLAYQTDMTRISTFMLAREVSAHSYPEIGVSDSHHPLSHHQDEAAKLERLHKINEYHFQQFAYLVKKLAAAPEGDGKMLDYTLFLYGTGISDSNTHFHDDLPIALIGGKNAGIVGGRFLRHPKGTPLTNLHVSILGTLGVPVEKFGDSTGPLTTLTGRV